MRSTTPIAGMMFPTVLLAISSERRMMPQPRTASIVLTPLPIRSASLGILDDVVDDDPRHDEDEEDIEDARPVLGRPRPDLEEGEADDEGPQEVESHVGLLGDEPEEGGVEKIEAVDGAEDLQGEIVSPLQFSLSPPFAEETLILQVLDDLTENAHSILPIMRLPPDRTDGRGYARSALRGHDTKNGPVLSTHLCKPSDLDEP